MSNFARKYNIVLFYNILAQRTQIMKTGCSNFSDTEGSKFSTFKAPKRPILTKKLKEIQLLEILQPGQKNEISGVFKKVTEMYVKEQVFFLLLFGSILY